MSNTSSGHDVAHDNGSQEVVNSAGPGPFAYRLPSSPDLRDCEELISRVLGLVFDVVAPTVGGKRVEIDGFAYRDAPMEMPPVLLRQPVPDKPNLGSSHEDEASPYRPLAAVAATEPRVALVGQLLRVLLAFVDLYESGKAVAPEGFGLKFPESVTIPCDGDPAAVMSLLSRTCDSSCGFCCVESNPEGTARGVPSRRVTNEELRRRIDAFRPDVGSLMYHESWGFREILSDPRTLDVMKRLREMTSSSFSFVTNGNRIDTAFANQLRELQPVVPIVSVNTSDRARRVDLMHPKRGRVGGNEILSSLRALRDAGVAFGASILPWPGPTLDGLDETLRDVSETGPSFIRVLLPGYTKCQGDVGWDTTAVWDRIVHQVRSARNALPQPVFTVPSMYEVETTWEDPLATEIVGVVPGSLAARGGLRPGDQVIEVDGIPIHSRLDLLALLSKDERKLNVRLLRSREGAVDVALEQCGGALTNYLGKYFFPRGLVLPWGLSSDIPDTIRGLPHANEPRRIFLFVSPLMKRSLDALVARDPDPLWQQVETVVPMARFFGGNITVMDMCVVDDFTWALRDHVRRPTREDLILVPSTSFNSWGRDLMGVHWRTIELTTGVPTQLLPCPSFRY